MLHSLIHCAACFFILTHTAHIVMFYSFHTARRIRQGKELSPLQRKERRNVILMRVIVGSALLVAAAFLLAAAGTATFATLFFFALADGSTAERVCRNDAQFKAAYAELEERAHVVQHYTRTARSLVFHASLCTSTDAARACLRTSVAVLAEEVHAEDTRTASLLRTLERKLEGIDTVTHTRTLIRCTVHALTRVSNSQSLSAYADLLR